jgi:hypothetical protein
MFCLSDLWNLCSFWIKEELLCSRVKLFAFQVTACIGLLKKDYYVQEIDLSNFLCFGAEFGHQRFGNLRK